MATTLTREALRSGRADSVEPIRSLADRTVCPGCTGVCAFIAVDVKGRGAARHGPCQPLRPRFRVAWRRPTCAPP